MRRTLIVSFLLIFSLVLALSAQTLDDPDLPADERRRAVREQENRWNMNPEDLLFFDRPGQKRPAPATEPRGLSERFKILPGQTTELVLKSGTRISIPAGSFVLPDGAGELTAEVVELRKPEDFAFAGISTEMPHNGRPAILESAGMVHLRFLWQSTEVILASSARLRLEMEPAAYGTFNVYRRNASGVWDLRGPAKENRTSSQPAECTSECAATSTLIFDAINMSGWWNFDQPKDEFTCITGTVHGNQEGATYGTGVDRNWSSYGEAAAGKPGRFVMNVMRGERARVISIADKKGKVSIGTIPAFRTQDLITHTKLDHASKCQEIGTVEMKEMPAGILKDKKRFLEAIKWEG